MTEKQGRVGLALRGYRLGKKIKQKDMAGRADIPVQRLNKIEMSKVKPTAREMLAVLKVLGFANYKFLTLLMLLNDIDVDEGIELALVGFLPAADETSDYILAKGCTMRFRKINGRTLTALVNEQKCVESGMVAEADKALEKYANSISSSA